MSIGRMISGLCVVMVVTFGCVTVAVIPQSDAEIMDNAVDYFGEFDPEYTWKMPVYNSSSYVYSKTAEMTFTMDISETDYHKSMYSSVFRVKSIFENSASALITPDDPYVQKIAVYLLELTEGCTDYQRINTALFFVQTAIDYEYDSVLYGATERWAYPIETLYAHAGDCEDVSVLFASIMIAMGYDAVLLQYDGHVAAGVKVVDTKYVGRTYSDGDDTYLFCECAADRCTINAGRGLATKRIFEEPELVKPHMDMDAFLIGNAYYVMRNLVHFVTTV